MKTLNLIIAAALLLLAAQRQSLAGSATWATNPVSGDWNTTANWIPQTVPSTSSDVATFATSNQTQVGISAITEIGGINFNPGADAFTIISQPGDPVTLSGSGIVNQSGKLQTFLCEIDGGLSGVFFFRNSATAGDMTSFRGSEGSFFYFNDTSSAGSAAFDLGGGTIQSSIVFWDASTAADSTITAQGEVAFFDTSTAANAHITVSGGAAFLSILGPAQGGHVVATCIGGDQNYGATIVFQGNASAEQGTYTAIGARSGGEKGSYIYFGDTATADQGAFIIEGGMGAGLEGTSLIFVDTTTAANGNITANGGVDGSDGGIISFQDQSKGGKATITLNGNSELDISIHNAPGVTIGSLVGQGSVFLGSNTLTIGSNNQSTTFSGAIQESGSLTKTGTGTLTLTGANTYTGLTTVSAGVLKVANRSGSATGTGAVTVNAGTVGGKGTITGPATIGTGSGTGAFLAPSVGSNKPATLTLEGLLTFKSDGTYTYNLDTKSLKADQVAANGVTIQSGTQFSFSAVSNKRLPPGQVFTAISNTSASPISGTFANLADDSTFTAGRNKFQVSYAGGDGNDLTLTVVR